MEQLESTPGSKSLTQPRTLLSVGIAALAGLSCSAVIVSPRGVGITGTPSGAPTHFNQSCGPACAAPVAPSTGEILVPATSRAGQVLETAIKVTDTIQGLLTVAKFLDEAQMKKAEDILAECASEANFKVNEELFGPGKSLPESECLKKPTVANPTAETWGQHLGKLKHAAAFRCVQQRLAKDFPDNFSIEPRYYQDPVTEEVMLTNRRFDSLRPDVVIHFTKNATRIQCIYDFKFPCRTEDKIDPLNSTGVMNQLREYHELQRSCIPAIVTPGHGVYRPESLR